MVMLRRGLLAVLGAALCGIALAQAEPVLRPGQVVQGSFTVEGAGTLAGQFTVGEVKGNLFTGQFSGPMCGTAVYAFKGRLEGDQLEVTSSSRWGPISVSARRVAEDRFAGTFTGRSPGKVELTLGK